PCHAHARTQLVARVGGDPAPSRGAAVEQLVVEADQLAVRGEPDIALEVTQAEGGRPREGRRGVLGGEVSAAPVRDGQRLPLDAVAHAPIVASARRGGQPPWDCYACVHRVFAERWSPSPPDGSSELRVAAFGEVPPPPAD